MWRRIDAAAKNDNEATALRPVRALVTSLRQSSLFEDRIMATTTIQDRTEAPHHPSGWRRYLYSTNHKDIGTMYLVFAIFAGLIGAGFSIGMRMELMYPGLQIFPNSHTFNVFVTAHGLLMIFFTLSLI